ncbi:RTC4-like domain-containing protein [Fomes fomentarius]|nr:RTC4-like domain-containing protein [Fomes fomentarius]
MERYRQQLKGRGTTLDTDTSRATRLPHAPQSMGIAFEDLGSDFGRQRSQPRSSTSSPHKRRASSKGTTIALNDDFSDDEIDFLSGSSRHGSETPQKPRKSSKPKSSVTVAEPLAIVIDRHQANPNYRAIDYKRIKIPKKSSAASSAAQTPENSQEPRPTASGAGQSSSRPVSQSRSETRAISPVQPEKEKPRRKVPLRERSPNQDRPWGRRVSTPPREKRDTRKEQVRDMDTTPRPSRPAPRPANKVSRSSLGKSQTVPDLGVHSSQDKAMSHPMSRSQTVQDIIHLTSSESDSPEADVSETERRMSEKARGKVKAKADPFSSISPLSSQTDKQGAINETDQGRTLAKSKGKKGRERADPFSTLSPLKSPVRPKRTDTLSSFPMPSPLSSPATRHSSSPSHAKTSGSQRRTVIMTSSDDDDNDDTPERPLRPFPMETQVLASIHSTSPVGKRSGPGSGTEGPSSTYRKKRRREIDKFSLDVDSDSDEDMALVDPKTLCPWCDERLPSEPTPHLRALMAAAKRVSRPEDRLANPLGLRAPLTAFVGVCQRHRFERDWIPRARRKGWPTKIAWDKLVARISRVKSDLKAIVDDVDEDFAPDVSQVSSNKRPRKQNEFWQEVVKNVRQHGSRQTAGARGQFQHFNKTQPGYYGELGYVIIHQTLCDLFPPADFHPDATLPLTPSDFIALVLVPEAAVRLIIDDLSLPRDKAIETLRESVEYGVAMFPADEGEGDLANESALGSQGGRLGATETMFMERARARRKEIEEEERREEEEALRAQTETETDSKSKSKSKPRPKPKGKGKASGAQTDVESIAPTSSPPSSGSGSKRKTRVVTRDRSTSRNVGPGVGSIIIELSSDTAESEAAGPSKRRKKARGAKTDVGMSDAATDEPTPKAPKVKPRPRPKPRSASITSRDSDVQEVEPPSSSQPTPFVSFSARGEPSVQRVASQTSIPVDASATPRAKPKARKSDTLSIIPSPPKVGGSQSGAKPPLQIARERRQQHTGTAR